MSFEKAIQHFKNIKIDKSKRLSKKEIDQFIYGQVIDEPLFRSISDTFKLHLWCLDLETFEIHLTPGAYSILGISPGQYDYNLIEGLKHIVHPNFMDYVETEISKGLIDLKSDPVVFKIIRDNEEVWLMIKGHAYNNDITSGLMVGFIADTTDLMSTHEAVSEKELFLDSIFEAIPTPVYYKDLESRYLNCNKAFITHLGRARSEVVGKTTHDIHKKEAADYYCLKDTELINNKKEQIYDAVVENTNEEQRLVRFYKNVVQSTDGTVKGIVGAMTDITEINEKEMKLQKMNRLLESLMEVSQAVLDMNTYEELFNVVIEKAVDAIDAANYGAVLMRDEDDFVTIIAQRGYDPNTMEGFKLPIQNTFLWKFTEGKLDKPLIIYDIPKVAKDFPEIMPPDYDLFIKSSLSTPITINGEVIAIISVDSSSKNVFDDHDIEMMTLLRSQIELVIRNMRLYQQVVLVSQTDPLTGIYNRGYFESTVDSIIKKAVRYDESFCLALIDLNNLKIVNDLFGHDIGDKYIQNFVSIIKEGVRESDLLARFGGDEFIVVFHNCDPIQLTDRLEQINREFMKEELIENQSIVQSFSYGIAKFPQDSEKYNELVHISDERMYHYKRILKSGMYYKLND